MLQSCYGTWLCCCLWINTVHKPKQYLLEYYDGTLSQALSNINDDPPQETLDVLHFMDVTPWCSRELATGSLSILFTEK